MEGNSALSDDAAYTPVYATELVDLGQQTAERPPNENQDPHESDASIHNPRTGTPITPLRVLSCLRQPLSVPGLFAHT